MIPELLEVSKIAKAIGWPTRKMRRFLHGNGMSFQANGMMEHLIFREEFEAKLPKIYLIFIEKYESGTLLEGRGGTRKRREKRKKSVERSKRAN
jgi:hypothetical protein